MNEFSKFAAGLQFGFNRRLPSILQTEAAECGLASLAMIARYHGHDVDLPGLRQRFSTSLKGANLTRVMAIATDLGFDARPLRLELGELPQLKTPCVLHWNLNHFVVLKQATAREVVIHDPARGVRRMPLAEVSKLFTGIALELSPRPDFRPIRAREALSLRALTGRVLGLKRALALIFGLALALEVFALGMV
jgi:ATP-binding cassette subfamily B protein RaxB